MPYIQTATGGELNRHVYELWLRAGSSNPTPTPPPIETTGAHVISAGREEVFFDHGFETAAVVMAFTPSWNTSVYPGVIESNRLSAKFNVEAPVKNAALDFVVSPGIRESVAAGSESQVITHNLGDASAVILVSVDWNTQIWRTAKTSNALTIAFSNPPSMNSYIYWSRHASDDDLTGTDTVTADSETRTITHNADQPFCPIFLLPSWNTAIRYASKIESNLTTVVFSTPPSIDSALDWRVKYLI